jgi:folate-binding protein YgfZ
MNPQTFFVDCNQAEFLYQKGLDGLDLLDRLSTNSILGLSEKGIKTTIVTDEKGKIVDILNVWKINNEKLLLESSTSNIDKLVFWINKFTIEEDSELQKMKYYSKISIIGSDLQELHSFLPDLVSVKKGNFIDISIRSSKFLIGKHELFNGSESVDFICLDGVSSRVELKQLVSDMNIPEIKQEEFELYRIKNLIPKSGKEITDSYNPLDLGLERFIDFSKGCYVGQEVVARLDTYNKVQNIMHMVKLDEINSNMRGTKITSLSGEYAIAISKKKFI